jgi:predicted transcriptional regulator YheO
LKILVCRVWLEIFDCSRKVGVWNIDLRTFSLCGQRVWNSLIRTATRAAEITQEFLENYERSLRLIGKSFPNTGIEILLHNLADPAHSLITLENNVTGRHLRDGTTNLLIDLKRRQLLNEDKSNSELNIGARKFKRATIPIKRKKFGIVGGICINIDANSITDQVLQDRERIISWFQNLLRTDMTLDENILSKDEYAKALKGKRHFKEDAI